MKNTNVVNYARTAHQSEQSLKDQLEACREFSGRNGFDVVGESSKEGTMNSPVIAVLESVLESVSEGAEEH